MFKNVDVSNCGEFIVSNNDSFTAELVVIFDSGKG